MADAAESRFFNVIWTLGLLQSRLGHRVMNYETITVSKDAMVGVITLNRPQAMNALSATMVTELISALSSFEKDDGVRCLVIAGSERAFSAGADIKEMAEMTA